MSTQTFENMFNLPFSSLSKRQTYFFICFVQVWGHQDTEVGAVLPRVTLHKLSWKSHSSAAVRGPAEEGVVQCHIFYYHHCTVFQIHTVTIKSSCHLWQAKLTEKAAGPSWLLVPQTLKYLQEEELVMPLAADAPSFWEDIANCGTSILWWSFPNLEVTCKEKSKWWESQGEKNSYSSGAPVGEIRMWGYLGWLWSKRNQNPFSPFHFAFSVGPAPLFPHPPPACLVMQEEEAKESNIMLEIGLEGQ